MTRFSAALVAAISTVAFTQIASAADLPAKAPVLTPPPPVYNWAGFYIGGNAGWLGSTANTVTNTGTDTGTGGFGTGIANGSLPQSVSVDYSGFLGGVQVGYNWQSGSWVYGLEGDIDWSNADGSTTVVNLVGPFNPPITSIYNRELKWLGTLRARVGITATPAFLLYATGGLAVGNTKLGNRVICPNFGPPCESEPSTTNTDSRTSAGWTVGGGLEWMFAPHWSLKVEYLYVDLGSQSSTVTYSYGDVSTMTSSVSNRENIVRGGINYHF